MTEDPDRQPPQARAFALVALVALGPLVLLDARYRSAEGFQPLLLLHVVQAALATTVLVAARTAWAHRHEERLVWALVLGSGVSLYPYFWSSPESPGLNANFLTCLLVSSAVLFSWSGRRTLAVSAAVWSAFALVGLAHRVPGAPLWIAVGGLGAGAVVAVTCAGVLEQYRSALAERHAELRDLSARLVTAREAERRHLSHELHEELGQALSAVGSHLFVVERELPEPCEALRQHTAEARRLLTRTLGEMRQLPERLCPPALTLCGLAPSLGEHLTTFGERHRIRTDFSAEGLPEGLPAELETVVYHIAQEALTNVVRHAHARCVHVRLGMEAGMLRLEIEDDGIGLPADGIQVGTGLASIREQSRALGGRVTLGSGSGTTLRVLLPCRVGGRSGHAGRGDASDAARCLPSRLRVVRGATARGRTSSSPKRVPGTAHSG